MAGEYGPPPFDPNAYHRREADDVSHSEKAVYREEHAEEHGPGEHAPTETVVGTTADRRSDPDARDLNRLNSAPGTPDEERIVRDGRKLDTLSAFASVLSLPLPVPLLPLPLPLPAVGSTRRTVRVPTSTVTARSVPIAYGGLSLGSYRQNWDR